MAKIPTNIDIFVTLSPDSVIFELRQGNQSIDKRSAFYYHNLIDVLLGTLDMLLKEHHRMPLDIENVYLDSNLGQDTNSIKIFQAFRAGLLV